MQISTHHYHNPIAPKKQKLQLARFYLISQDNVLMQAMVNGCSFWSTKLVRLQLLRSYTLLIQVYCGTKMITHLVSRQSYHELLNNVETYLLHVLSAQDSHLCFALLFTPAISRNTMCFRRRKRNCLMDELKLAI